MRLRSLILLSILALVAAPACATTPQHAAGSAAEERAGLALQAAAFRGAELAALVVDAADGEVLFARHPDQTLIPASNQKLLTALAALHTFGPTHRFLTSVHADALPGPDGVVDALYVRGGGDPALTSEDWWRLAADLRRAGLRRVGDLVLDDSAFDAVRWHPSWNSVSSRAYHAPVGALAANYGAFSVTVRPGTRAGAPAFVAVDPPVPYLVLRNQARTGLGGRASRVVVERRAGAGREEVAVSGVIEAGAPERIFYRSVVDPALYAGAVLCWQLRANGIECSGSVRRGPLPREAPQILEFEGRPLVEIVRLFLKYSNNMIAEALVKAMGSNATGAPGSWSTGMQVLRDRLRALGLHLGGVRLVDGSGLSRENRVSPRLLVEALRRARRSFAFGPEFVAALPIAAADGTLAERVAGAQGELRAKTGLLDHVIALSGYAEAISGRELVFSLLVNGHHSSDRDVMQAVDRFAQALVSGPSEAPTRGRGPNPPPTQESVLKPGRP